MRVLLLHPDDQPWGGEWSAKKWDWIVDLGFASSFTYEEWARRLGARVFSVYQFAGEMDSYRWVNEVIEHGRGKLFDAMGLDWWDILSMEAYQQLQLLYLLKQLRAQLGSADAEVSATRPHLFAQLFERATGNPVRYFRNEREGIGTRVDRMLRSVRNLRAAQISEIAFDKWDAGYAFRRHRHRGKRAKLADPATLIPSAYSNVTRSALAYASNLPKRRFLLATTRKSAVPSQPPANVGLVSLAAYAEPPGDAAAELKALESSWSAFLVSMKASFEEYRIASDAGLWNYFPAHLKTGLLLRNTWKNLLDSEPISGVLCGDDLNYHTRLPLILASYRNLKPLYCSHGALDGGFLFKKPFADTYLVKGEMESNYLQRVSGIRGEKIVVAAPGPRPPMRQKADGAVVFFSQPLEVESGRMDEIYREILPELWDVAVQSGKKLLIKLHPFESVRQRRKLLESILPQHANEIEMVRGVPPEQVMERTWCGITIDSSVAVECAIRGIPFFLCGWLDFQGMGYLRQYEKFGVGRVLESPEEIANLPRMVSDFKMDGRVVERLWSDIDPAQFDDLIFARHKAELPKTCAS